MEFEGGLGFRVSGSGSLRRLAIPSVLCRGCRAFGWHVGLGSKFTA